MLNEMATKQFTFRIEPDLMALMRIQAESEGRSVANLVKYLMKQYIASATQDKKGKKK